MTPFSGEILGTMLLLLLGDGTVANVVLATLRHPDCQTIRAGGPRQKLWKTH